MVEIERKFLVTSEVYKTHAHRNFNIAQGYLNRDSERTVRVRLKDDKAYLTVKGKSNDSGTTRLEWETEIEASEARALLAICEEYIIEKIRYEVKVGDHVFEVDEFFGNNEGLVVAEIELGSESETFEKPSWLGAEVTGTIEYYNAQLSIHPYEEWLV